MIGDDKSKDWLTLRELPSLIELQHYRIIARYSYLVRIFDYVRLLNLCQLVCFRTKPADNTGAMWLSLWEWWTEKENRVSEIAQTSPRSKGEKYIKNVHWFDSAFLNWNCEAEVGLKSSDHMHIPIVLWKLNLLMLFWWVADIIAPTKKMSVCKYLS